MLNRLQTLIDKLIISHGGTDAAADFLELMFKDGDDSKLSFHIAHITCEEFGISIKQLFSDDNRFAPQRAICFYFHKKYQSDKLTVRAIAGIYNKKQSAFYNGIQNVENILSTKRPKADLELITSIDKKINSHINDRTSREG